MCHGVSKSGSPIPREITSFILATISKKSRMPDFGRSTTWRAMNRLWSMVGGRKPRRARPRPIPLRRLRRDLEPFRRFGRDVDRVAALLIGAQHEMGAGGQH